VHDGDYCQCLERAELVREGTDVTIFCYSRMRYVVMQAVQELEKQGYNPEVGQDDCLLGGVGWGGVGCGALYSSGGDTARCRESRYAGQRAG
jgi:hypothetical protein